MKQFFTLLSLLLVMGMSANVMAQSTGSAPFPGAKHQYQVNAGSEGGSTFEWTVWANVDNVLTNVTGTNATVSAVGSGATNNAEVYITWVATEVEAEEVYFVQVKETDTDGCTNTKALVVTITESTFNLEITAAATDCYDSDVVVTSAAGQPVYTHGTATLIYTVTPDGLGENETYSFTATPSITTGWTAAAPTVTSGNGNIDTDGSVTTTNDELITIEYVITKTDTNDNDDAADVADFTSQVAITSGLSSLGVSSNATGAQDASTAVSRPQTTTITALD